MTTKIIRRVLLAFILVLTLIPMIFNIHLGNLFFKFILYGIMLLFFAYELNKIDFDEISFKTALRNEFDSIFEVSDIYHISFIVIANILFVSAIYFLLKYLAGLSILQFDAPLYGDFTYLSGSVMALYFISIVILSPSATLYEAFTFLSLTRIFPFSNIL